MVTMQVDEEVNNGTRSPAVTQAEPRTSASYFTEPIISLERAHEFYAACFIRSSYMLSEVYKVSNNRLEACQVRLEAKKSIQCKKRRGR
jgi:hypothetical protein